MLKKTITIVNQLGLHARAAAKFVSTASRYASSIEISRQGKSVNGKSIMGVMMLAASHGNEVELTTTGEDEQDAMNALIELIQNRFGEEN